MDYDLTEDDTFEMIVPTITSIDVTQDDFPVP